MVNMNDLENPNIMEGLDPNSPYYEQNQAILNSPEHQARIEEQKRKIAEFKAAQTQAPEIEMDTETPEAEIPTEVPETQSQGPTSADRLYNAQISDNRQRFYAQLLRSFQSALQGAAPNSGFKVDPNLAAGIEGMATSEANVKAQLAQEAAGRKEARENKESELRQDEFQMRIKKMNLDFQDMEANRDPNSPQSKVAQDRVLEVQKKLGKPVNEQQIRSMSGEQLFKSFGYLQEDLVQYYKNQKDDLDRQSRERVAGEANKQRQALLDLKKSTFEIGEKRRSDEQIARREREDIQQNRELSKDIYGVVKDFEKDDTVKALKKEDLGFAQADELIKQIESGNEIALGALGTKMARAMGEVGVLTESDVQRYIQAQSVVQKAKDKFQRNFMGHLSEQTIKDIKEVTAKMKEGFIKRRQEVQDKYVNYAYQNFGKGRNMTYDEVASKFGIGGSPQSTTQESTGPYGDTTERNGKKYKWNATANKYQLIE